MKLANILGYQLESTRHAASRSLQRYLAGGPLGTVRITALLAVRDTPGCHQTALGRVLSGNRSVGMKVATRLEAEGLLERGAGRDRRSKGLHLTAKGRAVLDEALIRHARAEAALAARLEPGERETLLVLLAKVRQALREDEQRAGDG